MTAVRYNQTLLSFKSKVVATTALLAMLTAVMLLAIVNIEHFDVTTYHQLVASSEPTQRTDGEASFTTCQRREKVRKTILFSEPGGRRYFRLASEQSDLVFTFQNDKGEAVEYLTDVDCDIQQELYYLLADGTEATRQSNGRLLVRDADPSLTASWVDESVADPVPMQRVRHLEAATATYFYDRDLFAAEQVDLTHFFVSQHNLLDSWEQVQPMMHGLAQAVQFSMLGQRVAFQADHLKMTLFSQEGLF